VSRPTITTTKIGPFVFKVLDFALLQSSAPLPVCIVSDMLIKLVQPTLLQLIHPMLVNHFLTS